MTVDLWILAAALTPAVLFCVVYGLRYRWYRTPEGRQLFGLTAVLAALLARSIWLRATAPVPEVSSWFLRLLVILAALFLWHQLWLLAARNREDGP